MLKATEDLLRLEVVDRLQLETSTAWMAHSASRIGQYLMHNCASKDGAGLVGVRVILGSCNAVFSFVAVLTHLSCLYYINQTCSISLSNAC